MRRPRERPRRGRAKKTDKETRSREASAPLPLDAAGSERFRALKVWRGEVARSRNLPAYVVFHDATLAEMARLSPRTLHELARISGVGTKKLEAYGADLLRVLADARG
jgi:ATP-dependent DNA helicase RecQ